MVMKLDKLKALLVRYIPDEQNIIDTLVDLDSADNKKLNVVVYGSYNSGKSTLLNSIIGALDSEYFPSNDIRETRVNKIFEQNNVCFIDTPGLDVNDSDTQEANSGAARGDVLLFVHKLTAGSIQRHDLDAIKCIFESHTNPETVLFIITAGEVASSNQAVIEEMTRQIRQELSDAVEFFVVSNSVYKKGILEDKQKLVEFSGMRQLQERLQVIIQDTFKSYSESREEKRKKILDTCLKAVQQMNRDKQNAVRVIHEQDTEFKKAFLIAVKKLKNNVNAKMKEIESI